MGTITIVVAAVIFAICGIGIGWYIGRRQARGGSRTPRVSAAGDLPSFGKLIDILGFAVFIVDRSKTITTHNNEATRLAATGSVDGQSLDSVLHLKDEEGNAVQLLPSKLEGRQVVRRDIIIERDNQQLMLEATISEFMAGDGKPGGHIVMLRDISGEKTLEQRQNEFIATAWHELRTPLAIAEGYLGTSLHKLNTESGDPQLIEWLKKAHDNMVGLAKLANDMGTLYLAEKDSLTVSLDKINAVTLLQDIIDSYKDRAAEKQIFIKFDVPASEVTIVGSTSLLARILSEMVENAVKFSPQGEVVCSVKKADDSQDIIFSVTDTGKGIAESLRPNLFKRFFRGAQNFESTGDRGIGIGLAITARLAERLGGKIWYEDSKEKGSTFNLQMPPYPVNNQDSHQVADIETQRLYDSI